MLIKNILLMLFQNILYIFYRVGDVSQGALQTPGHNQYILSKGTKNMHKTLCAAVALMLLLAFGADLPICAAILPYTRIFASIIVPVDGLRS